ncbi:MAG TPA: hypothetical protein VGS22_04000 [Thermoanaerobaculia bacterium]|jgi:hypothetical protein|nr:hypothetical protein [Thermoanaerobaculia bacterium]
MNLRRRFTAGLWAVALPLALGAPGFSQASRPAKKPAVAALTLHAYTFVHQPASEAMPLVHPMLSERGTVELQPADNTIAIRDTRAVIARIMPLLREFDHPIRALSVEVMIVKASRAVMSPPVSHSDLPPDLTRRLRSLLPYEIYDLAARAELSTAEGETVAYDLGQDFQVSFRVGTVHSDKNVRLAEFLVRRSGRGGAGSGASSRPKPLIFTNLNLALDQNISLALAKSEESREALMIVLTVRAADREP